MNEPHEDITDQPDESPRTTDFTNEPPRADAAYEPSRFTLPAPKSNKIFLLLVVGSLLLCLAVLGIGLLIPAVQKVRSAATRSVSQNNLKEMVQAVNNIAVYTNNGEIPPSYGPWPPNSTTQQSFFVSLLPYIQQGWLASATADNGTAPVRFYSAPADPFNPQNNSLISYGSNATLLTLGGKPTFPGSFGGRPSNSIVVFERTAKTGATWSNTSSYLTDTNGSSSPEFTAPSSWSNSGSKATAFLTTGCYVGMGDGSCRLVTQSNANAGWAWAMDPSIGGTSAPNGW